MGTPAARFGRENGVSRSSGSQLRNLYSTKSCLIESSSRKGASSLRVNATTSTDITSSFYAKSVEIAARARICMYVLSAYGVLLPLCRWTWRNDQIVLVADHFRIATSRDGFVVDVVFFILTKEQLIETSFFRETN